MTDTPKKPDADKEVPPAPTKRPITAEELKRRGFIIAPPSGKGFGLPLHGPRPNND